MIPRDLNRVLHSAASLEERCNAVEIVYWASREFGSKLAVTSSFQTQSLPLLHVISRICPNTPIFFIDTGFHFPETLAFLETIKKKLGLNIVELKPLIEHEEFLKQHGELHQDNPNMCCYMNKVEPLQRELTKYDAWISGIRRDQTNQRADTQIISMQENGLYKICPMVNWTEKNVDSYIEKLHLPKHPLHKAGYRSIGCACCTVRTTEGQDARSGRWSGKEKTECGLHDCTSKRKETRSQ